MCEEVQCGRENHHDHSLRKHSGAEVYFAMIQDAYFSDGIWRCYNCSAVSHTISEFVKLEYHGGRLVKIVDYKIHPELVRHSMDRACILCGEKCSQNSELRTHYKKKHNALVQSENTFLLGMSTQDMSCCHV